MTAMATPPRSPARCSWTRSACATDFDIDATMQDTLFKSGRKTANKFLAGWDFDEYVKTYRSGGDEPIDVSEPEPAVEV
jgi:hypothetical protein